MTNDDLQQFQKLLEANNKQLRQDLREDIKAEVDPLHERLDAQGSKSPLLKRTFPAK
jgi:hypothetical protein